MTEAASSLYTYTCTPTPNMLSIPTATRSCGPSTCRTLLCVCVCLPGVDLRTGSTAYAQLHMAPSLQRLLAGEGPGQGGAQGQVQGGTGGAGGGSGLLELVGRRLRGAASVEHFMREMQVGGHGRGNWFAARGALAGPEVCRGIGRDGGWRQRSLPASRCHR